MHTRTLTNLWLLLTTPTLLCNQFLCEYYHYKSYNLKLTRFVLDKFRHLLKNVCEERHLSLQIYWAIPNQMTGKLVEVGSNPYFWGVGFNQLRICILLCADLQRTFIVKEQNAEKDMILFLWQFLSFVWLLRNYQAPFLNYKSC